MIRCGVITLINGLDNCRSHRCSDSVENNLVGLETNRNRDKSSETECGYIAMFYIAYTRKENINIWGFPGFPDKKILVHTKFPSIYKTKTMENK